MRVWTVSEVKAGTLTQCLGIGRHFDSEPHSVIVRRKLKSWHIGPLFPHRDLPREEPDLLISCGSMAPAHLARIARRFRRRPFTVHLQKPPDPFIKDYDMAFISHHDWTPARDAEPRFHRMLGVPHQITWEALAPLREAARARWVKEGKAVTILVGGTNEAYRYDHETLEHLISAIERLASQGWTCLVSTSRRSHQSILERLLGMPDPRIVIWDRKGENPYRQFLAAADAFLVTKDTVTMHCEALTTGRPVYTFDLGKIPGFKLDKFEWFHNDLSRNLGLTRPFEGALLPYEYTPPRETERVVGLIRQAIAERRAEAS